MTIAITGSLAGPDNPFNPALAAALSLERPVACIAEAELASRAGAEAALARIARESGGPVAAVIHAQVSPAATIAAPLAEMTDAEWDQRCEAPLRTTINLFQATYGQMRDTGGVVILVQPTIGLAGQKGFAAHAAACEGQRNLVKAAARAWGRKGIRVHAIAMAAEAYGGDLAARVPGASTLPAPSLKTRTTDQLTASLVATVKFLLSEGAAGLTGTTTAVDGGGWMPL